MRGCSASRDRTVKLWDAVRHTTRRTLPVELTRYGNTYLRHHRNVRVSLTATTRDLLANTATTTARGRLR